MSTESPFKPSPPAPLPEKKGEGSKKGYVHSRGGFKYSGLKDTARDLRQKETEAELVVWKLLRNRSFMGLKFRRQHQIGLYIVDFYCDELKLILELDGDIHFTKEQIEKDKLRDEYLKSSGFVIFRFENYEVLNKQEILLKIIEKVVLFPLSLFPGRGARGEGS